jgi:hypothetical protein
MLKSKLRFPVNNDKKQVEKRVLPKSNPKSKIVVTKIPDNLPLYLKQIIKQEAKDKTYYKNTDKHYKYLNENNHDIVQLSKKPNTDYDDDATQKYCSTRNRKNETNHLGKQVNDDIKKLRQHLYSSLFNIKPFIPFDENQYDMGAKHSEPNIDQSKTDGYSIDVIDNPVFCDDDKVVDDYIKTQKDDLGIYVYESLDDMKKNKMVPKSIVHRKILNNNYYFATKSIEQLETQNLPQKCSNIVKQVSKKDERSQYGLQYLSNVSVPNTSNFSSGFFGMISNLFQACCNNAMVGRDGKAHFNASVMSRENRP